MSAYDLPGRFPAMYEQAENGKWCCLKKARPRKGLCHTPFCTNRLAPSCRNVHCTKCRARVGRANNLVKATFDSCRHKAKRRGIPFTLTLEEFAHLCEDSQYHQFRGRRASDLHLDRIDSTRGYETGNVQVVTASENCTKARNEVGYHASGEAHEPECPF